MAGARAAVHWTPKRRRKCKSSMLQPRVSGADADGLQIWSKIIHHGRFELELIRQLHHVDSHRDNGANISAGISCIMAQPHVVYTGDELGRVVSVADILGPRVRSHMLTGYLVRMELCPAPVRRAVVVNYFTVICLPLGKKWTPRRASDRVHGEGGHRGMDLVSFPGRCPTKPPGMSDDLVYRYCMRRVFQSRKHISLVIMLPVSY